MQLIQLDVFMNIKQVIEINFLNGVPRQIKRKLSGTDMVEIPHPAQDTKVETQLP